MMEHSYGGFWRRGLAIFVDKIILYIIYLIIILVESLIFPLQPYSHSPDLVAGIWNSATAGLLIGHIIMGLFISAVYFTYFHGAIGQTPGKIMLKLKVIGIAGRNLNYGVAFLRWMGYIVSAMVIYLGFIWAAFDGKKQGWHDKIAGTVVVIVNRGERRMSQLNLWGK
ncbi:MAG TPA: RDD family protein [Syntrophales bacterium]|nr:RDD family protein [Syntrophales bacterium]